MLPKCSNESNPKSKIKCISKNFHFYFMPTLFVFSSRTRLKMPVNGAYVELGLNIDFSFGGDCMLTE